ncbi:hypothetical protein I5N37_17885, partial [Serratia marcescens]|nr:hypothetical protein [Serratia marcescens]
MSESGSFKDVRREVAYAYEKVKFFKTHMEMWGGEGPRQKKKTPGDKKTPQNPKNKKADKKKSGVLV